MKNGPIGFEGQSTNQRIEETPRNKFHVLLVLILHLPHTFVENMCLSVSTRTDSWELTCRSDDKKPPRHANPSVTARQVRQRGAGRGQGRQKLYMAGENTRYGYLSLAALFDREKAK